MVKKNKIGKNIKQYEPDPKIVKISAENIPTMALADLKEGLKYYESWLNFAFHDIKQKFRRSVFGPFWITISTSITIASIGFIFSMVFGQDISTFIPHLATGLIFWNFLRMILEESPNIFITQRHYIHNIPTPLSIYIYRAYTRIFFIWMHDMIVFLVVYIIFIQDFSVKNLLFLPGFLLFLLNLFWSGLIVTIVSTRFRDIPQILNNLLQIAFLITPIIWTIDIMEAKNRTAVIYWNPFYHILEIVRAPLLNSVAEPISWFVSASLALLGIPLSITLFQRVYARIPYWI